MSEIKKANKCGGRELEQERASAARSKQARIAISGDRRQTLNKNERPPAKDSKGRNKTF